ncbi:hypothetical protein ABZS95_15530 [Streptomyces sp. NPDC005479]|uniref:hypothetical protein n=1 Tax=unclassified Streptomyces TaxID=2593676 RepID=UPI0033B16128
MSDRLLRFPLTHQAFRLCDHTARRPERKQLFGGGLRGRSRIGLLGSAAQLTNVGAGPGMFVRVTVVPGEVIVHVRTRFTLSACLHEDAAEQMDDPVGDPPAVSTARRSTPDTPGTPAQRRSGAAAQRRSGG